MSETTFNFERAVGGYRDLRDQKSAIKKAADEQIAEIDSRLDAIERLCLKKMDEAGIDKASTSAGTVYRKHDTYFRIVSRLDLEAFLTQRLIEGDAEALTLVNLTASKEAMRQFMSDENRLPPGIETYSEISAGFRKPTSSKKEGSDE